MQSNRLSRARLTLFVSGVGFLGISYTVAKKYMAGNAAPTLPSLDHFFLILMSISAIIGLGLIGCAFVIKSS